MSKYLYTHIDIPANNNRSNLETSYGLFVWGSGFLMFLPLDGIVSSKSLHYKIMYILPISFSFILFKTTCLLPPIYWKFASRITIITSSSSNSGRESNEKLADIIESHSPDALATLYLLMCPGFCHLQRPLPILLLKAGEPSSVFSWLMPATHPFFFRVDTIL